MNKEELITKISSWDKLINAIGDRWLDYTFKTHAGKSIKETLEEEITAIIEAVENHTIQQRDLITNSQIWKNIQSILEVDEIDPLLQDNLELSVVYAW